MKKIIFLIAIFLLPHLLVGEALMLAKIYHSDIDVKNYLVSEKLDGVRARWNGKNLISRNGKIFDAPVWFTANFPQEVLDGELWSKRKDFENISAIARKKGATQVWKELKFWIFDLPLEDANFETRVKKMQTIVQKTNSSYLQMIKQISYGNDLELMQTFEKIIEEGGEGLMLHKKSAFYKKGRSNNLLKLKQYLDAEATVLGYKAGKGKYQGMMGSLQVKSDTGIIFFIGSGFTDEQRKNPPSIGSRVTFRYQSFTKNAIPRFPVFLRVRTEE